MSWEEIINKLNFSNMKQNIVLYGKYSIQFIIWWTITIISCCFLAIKCFVEYIYINILKVCAIILELCDNTFPENPMKRTIMDRRNQEPYIMRYYLVFKNRNLFPFNVFIHKILKSDDDKDLHDHPWNFFHLILSGGYWEETVINGDLNAGTEKIWRAPGYWNIVASDYKHRIDIGNKKPWTIFIPFKKSKKEWGFWVRQTSSECPTGYVWKKIPNKIYLQENNGIKSD
tara:strand:- start:131 stop:817 length:687 start_codon:yes stop_codon:yes gene_type:complete